MTHHPNYRELKEETNLDVEKLVENHVRTFEGNAVSKPICQLNFTYVTDITDAQLDNFHSNDQSYNSLLSEFREILTAIFYMPCSNRSKSFYMSLIIFTISSYKILNCKDG
ncbi:NUDIX hydrolase [Paenisporosarcina macmurdoensis]|uniref:NUDIX hydrolase n=1 Tax=Paenisporosarcina macmurdoensis TaxID=212659 RepID=A0ABW1L4E3_9BACL